MEIGGGDSGSQIFARGAKPSASEPIGTVLDFKISWGGKASTPVI